MKQETVCYRTHT